MNEVTSSASQGLAVVVVVANNNCSNWCPYLFQMFLMLIYLESRGKSSIEMWRSESCLKLSYRGLGGFKKWIRHVEFYKSLCKLF